MLSFSGALVIFTLCLIPVYLIILMFSERSKKERSGKSVSNGMFKLMMISLPSLVTLTFLFSNITWFKVNVTSTVLVPLMAGILLYILRLSPESDQRKWQWFVLFSLIMYHMTILYSPPSPINLGERTVAMVMLDREGSWDPAKGVLNPIYNPFPMDVGLFVIVSLLTSVPYTSGICEWVIFLPLIVAYDIVLYTLTKQISGNWVIGAFAVFIFSLMPPTNLVIHGSKWIGNLLMLVSALALIKALRNNSGISNIVLANITYTVAIFFHTSAAIGTFLVLGMMTIGSVGGLSDERVRFSYRSRQLRTALAVFAVITLTRIIYTMSYMESIMPSLMSFTKEMFSFEPGGGGVVLAYERTVNPINAYAWGTPISMASALALYSTIKRKALGGTLTFTLFAVGGTFLLLGFIAAAVVRAGGFHTSMYPAFALLVPAAATIGTKVLRSSKALATIIIILMITFSGVAVTDPMLSPEPSLMMTSKLSGSMESYIQSCTLIGIIPVDKKLVVSHGISSGFLYLNYTEGKVVPPSAPLSGRYAVDRIIENGEVFPETTYIWPKDIRPYLTNLPVNIAYDSGIHIVFFSSIK